MADLQHVGTCAIVGLPNAGKSTLVNRLVGTPLMAVSAKPQTTRNRVVGVVNAEVGDGLAQLVLVDTPGLATGSSGLRRFMSAQATSAMEDCEVVVHVLDGADRRQREPERWGQLLRSAIDKTSPRGGVRIAAINKIDRFRDKALLLPILQHLDQSGVFSALVPISARTGVGCSTLVEEIAKRLPPGPALFPEGMYTDRSERFLVAELIREQLFRQLGAEVPYGTAVEIESFEERPQKKDVAIAAVIHVERASHKPIVVGKAGARIRELGEKARHAIADLLGCEAHLRLFVRVTEDWSAKDSLLKQLGYDE